MNLLTLTTTPNVVMGLWFSMEATLRPFLSVDTFKASALTSSRSDVATAAWAANWRLAVVWTAGDFTMREAITMVCVLVMVLRGSSLVLVLD